MIALFSISSLADYESWIIDAIKKIQSPHEADLTPQNFEEMKQYRYMKARIELVNKVPKNPLPLYRGMAVFNLARSIGYNCQIFVSDLSIDYKSWCYQYFGDIELHRDFVGSIFYDNSRERLSQWLIKNPTGMGIMPTSPAERENYNNRIMMWDGKDETFEKIKYALELTYGYGQKA